MNTQRDDIIEAALESRPAATKRSAPPLDETKAKKQQRLQKEQEKYGVAKTYRLDKATVQAVKAAADELDIRVGELADFLLRAGLVMLDKGQIVIPLEDRQVSGKQVVKAPRIPGRYQP